MDELLKEQIEERYGLEVRILTAGQIRVTGDDGKRLDLYATRYFKPDTGERGDIKGTKGDMIEKFFGVTKYGYMGGLLP